MRDSFVAELMELAAADRSLVLITGDLGFGVLTEFARRFPDQFLNAGVAEQNMAGMAAGMAHEGRRVFIYSIGNFPTLRCLEQIRNDICMPRLPVTIVAVGGGFAYGPLGSSHHATEDVAAVGALPEIRVLAPSDPAEAAACTAIAGTSDGPTYLRLGRNGELPLHLSRPELRQGKMVQLRAGSDAAIVAACGALDLAIEASAILVGRRINAAVWSSPWLAPFDVATTAILARTLPSVVTVEEHSEFGGLGSRVSEVVASLSGRRARVDRVGIPRRAHHQVGSQKHLREAAGLTPTAIARRIEEALATVPGVR